MTMLYVNVLFVSTQCTTAGCFRVQVSTSTAFHLIQMLGNMGSKDPNLDGTIRAGSFLSSWHKLGYLRRSKLTWRLSPSALPLNMCVKHLTTVIGWRRTRVILGIVTPGKVRLSSVSKVTEQTRVWYQVSNNVSPSSLLQSLPLGLQVYMLLAWFPLMTVCKL